MEDDDVMDEMDELYGAETEMMQLRVDEVYSWYYKAFRAIKQLACKDIAKVWIGFCHPQKQTNFPYNGGKDHDKVKRSMKKYEYAGHYTMPDYWSPDQNWQDGLGARHREPDHLKKAG